MPGSDWPEFSIPTDGGGGDAPPPAEPSGSPAAPAEPVREGTGQAAPTPVDETIPKYRLDETLARLQTIERTNQQLSEALSRFMRQPDTPTTPAAEPDEETLRRQRIRDQILEVYPELKDAVELTKLRQRLEATITATEQRNLEDEQRYDAYAKRVISSVHDDFAPLILGKGKTGKDLSEASRDELKTSFIRWIGSAPDRVERYNRYDDTLRKEFIADWTARWVDPLKRSGAAALTRQARVTQNLPVSGTTSSPLGAPPARPTTPENEDEIYERAAKMAFGIRDGQTP